MTTTISLLVLALFVLGMWALGTHCPILKFQRRRSMRRISESWHRTAEVMERQAQTMRDLANQMERLLANLRAGE